MDPLLATTAGCIMVAATLHRVSGMGFGLIAMPVLVLAHGPVEGVRVGFVLGLAVSSLALVTTWRDVDPRRTALLCLPALATVPLGAYAAEAMSSAALLILIGSMLAAGLALARRSPELRLLRGPGGTLGAGAAAGFAHVTSGLSVPALTAYAMSNRWEIRSFAASAQVIFIVLNLTSLAARGTSGAMLALSAVLMPTMLLGMIVGARVAALVSAKAARRTTATIAWISACAAVVKGLADTVS